MRIRHGLLKTVFGHLKGNFSRCARARAQLHPPMTRNSRAVGRHLAVLRKFYKPACLQTNFHGRALYPSGDFHRTCTIETTECAEELAADSCPRKFDVLKTNICQGGEASRANMLVLRTSSFQGQLSDR